MANSSKPAQESTASSESLSDSYRVYLAGGLFTQHELAANVSMKEAVWRLSSGRFELVLPQSKELRHLETADLSAYLRNADLHQLVQSDVLIARFDGPELDTGAVVEFTVAKMLGKPSVIIRTDSRHLTGAGLDDPYNLMVKNWPRSIVVHIDSLIDYVRKIAEARETFLENGLEARILEAELAIVRESNDAMAVRLIEALNAVVAMESPYPPELQEMVYEAVRYAPGAGFDQLFTQSDLRTTLRNLMARNTL